MSTARCQATVTAFAALVLAALVASGCGTTTPRTVSATGPSSTRVPASVATTTAPEVTSDDPADADPRSTDSEADSEADGDATTTTSEAPSAFSGAEVSPMTTVRSSDDAAPDQTELFEQIEAAVERQDLCGVYDGLARFQFSGSSNRRLVEQLTRVHDVMDRSSSFVDPTVASDWATLSEGTGDMLASLRADPSAGKEAAATHYDDAGYRAASSAVAAWMDDNCD